MSTSSAPKMNFAEKYLAATDGEAPGASPSVARSGRGDNYPDTGGYGIIDMIKIKGVFRYPCDAI
jgi:hypothetical protein